MAAMSSLIEPITNSGVLLLNSTISSASCNPPLLPSLKASSRFISKDVNDAHFASSSMSASA